ncbi:MAG TPA: ribonuclease [Flavobacteriales bacterium]|jgi:PhoH-like ATPase|nr:ribonuclease [Flavobacteriales bacterium]
MARKKKQRKIFVLDTSVILFDHNAIKSFEDNDVAIPITVLEELDNFKKGNDTKNFEAREFIRILDKLSKDNSLQEWNRINGPDKGKFKVIMEDQAGQTIVDKIFGANKNDHRILNAALRLAEENKGAKVTVVSKDINLRLKANAVGIHADDYLTGKIQDVQNLYNGRSVIENAPQEFIDALFQNFSIPAFEARDFMEIQNNHYYILRNNKSSVLAFYNPRNETIDRVEKTNCYGIVPRNAEQAFAAHAILNPEIKLVTLQGIAGTGKTLLSLAASVESRRKYKQIYLARPIVPLSNKDIGYLPGDIKSKINPYMEPLWDNLKLIKNQWKETDTNYKRIEDMVNKEKILVTPLAYIRGRSLSNVMFIVDEAQNLTPHEIKTIITRAGENTKMVFTGDIYQIDTPYLDEHSNGLSYLIDRVKGSDMFAHVTLEKGERSELANLASELL